jgi:adenine-specific DNA-methyltransferase
MDYVESLTVERMKRAIKKYEYQAEFVYLELLKLNEIFVSRIKKEKEKSKLLNVWKEMSKKAFLGYRMADIKTISLDKLESLSIEDLKKFLLDSLDNNMLYVPLSEIEDSEYEVDSTTIKYNKQFFGETLDE